MRSIREGIGGWTAAFGLCGILLFWGAGCSSEDGPWVPDPDGVDPAVCDDTVTPVVFAHGVMEVGDAFANQSMRFAANGYCLDRVYAFDWNSVGGIGGELERFEAYVDRVLAETGAQQVNLVGHSMGTGLSETFLGKPENAVKVAHYVAIAGSRATSPPGGVPTMTISSEDDTITGRRFIEGAENVEIPGQDHLQVTTSPEAFSNMYRFFNEGREPRTLELEPTPEVRLAGRLLTFAENRPARGMELGIYPVNPATGERVATDPEITFTTDDEGFWGPFLAEPGGYYEYELVDPSGNWPPIHYYREPLPRSCDLVHFRVFPLPESFPSFVLYLVFKGLLGFNPEGMLLATLNMNQAVVHGRDTLFVDGYEISIPEVTAAEKTAIAIFYTDFPGVDPGEVPGINDGLVFIQTFDLVVETDTPRTVPLVYNDRLLAVRNWNSGTDGVVIAVFE